MKIEPPFKVPVQQHPSARNLRGALDVQVQLPRVGLALAMNHPTTQAVKLLSNSNTRVPNMNYLATFSHTEKCTLRVRGVFLSLCIESAAHIATRSLRNCRKTLQALQLP